MTELNTGFDSKTTPKLTAKQIAEQKILDNYGGNVLPEDGSEDGKTSEALASNAKESAADAASTGDMEVCMSFGDNINISNVRSLGRLNESTTEYSNELASLFDEYISQLCKLGVDFNVIDFNTMTIIRNKIINSAVKSKNLATFNKVKEGEAVQASKSGMDAVQATTSNGKVYSPTVRAITKKEKGDSGFMVVELLKFFSSLAKDKQELALTPVKQADYLVKCGWCFAKMKIYGVDRIVIKSYRETYMYEQEVYDASGKVKNAQAQDNMTDVIKKLSSILEDK